MKKLCFYVLFILILGSSCFAYTSNDVLAVLTILKDKGVITGLPTDYQGNSAWVGFVDSLGNINNKGYAIVVTGNNTNNYYNNVVSLYAPRGNTIVNHNFYPNEWGSYVDGVNWLSQYNFHNNMSNWTSGLLDCNKYNVIYAYTTVDINTNSLQLSAFEEYGGNYLSGSFEFTPTDTSGYINVHAFGTTESFIRRPFSTSVSNTRLGYISNIDDFYYIEGLFAYFINDSGDAVYSDTVAGFTKNQVGLYTNNLYLNSNGEVGVSTSKLLNKQGVALFFIYKETPESDYEYSDSYYYYTYYYGTNVQSGDLLSPDLNTTVDFSVLNAFEEAFNYTSGDSENLDYMVNSTLFNFGSGNFWSGDFWSGDVLVSTNYTDYTKNDYSLFIYSIYRQILYTIGTDDTTSSISFTLRGNTYTFNSSQFTTPNGPLKTFVSTFLIVGIIYLFYQQFHYLALSLTMLDLHTVLNTFDNRFTLFM